MIKGLIAATRSDGHDHTLGAWLNYHLELAEKAVVLIDVRPNQDHQEALDVCKRFGDRVKAVVQETENFRNDVTIDRLRAELAEMEPQGFDLVLHTDKDEFISWPDRIPAICARIRKHQSDYAEARMADRFAPGLKVIGDQYESLEELRAAAPVQTVLMNNYSCAEVKCYLHRIPGHHKGGLWIHHAAKDMKRDGDGMLLEHYRWTQSARGKTIEKSFQHNSGVQGAIAWRDKEVFGRSEQFLRLAEKKFRMVGERLPGWFDYADIYRDIVREADDGDAFVELGVWAGKSLSYFGQFAALSGKALSATGYDQFNPEYYLKLPSYQDGRVSVKTGEQWMERVNLDLAETCPCSPPKVLRSDAAKAAANHEAASLFAVFIDAGHTADEVERDIKAWLPKIKAGGILAGHDIDMNGVVEGLNRTGLKWRKVSSRSWRVDV